MIVETRCRRPRLSVLSFGMALTFSAVTATQEEAGPPARMALDPNAIIRDGQPLTIKLEGIPEGRVARIWMVKDCDGDGRPEDSSECPRLFEGATVPADRKNVVDHRLRFEVPEEKAAGYVRLVAAGGEVRLPRGVRLWLRASREGSDRFLQATFGFVEDECSILRTVIDAFVPGRCRPGLAQVLRRHRQPTDLVHTVFEVRRLAVGDPATESVAVPGTLGASGVAWLDSGTLLVTSAGSAAEGGLGAGLYRVPLAEGGEPELLWRPAEGGEGAVAPLRLSPKRAIFVTQRPGAQKIGAEEVVAWLRVVRLKSGEVEKRIPLPFKVHQLLAVGRDGASVLALSLGVADNLPIFMKVGLKDGGEAEAVGFSNSLYQSLMREPGGEVSAVAFENAFANYGWQIVLAQERKLIRDLVKRDRGHDLAPAWSPQGGELAYLAQVADTETGGL